MCKKKTEFLPWRPLKDRIEESHYTGKGEPWMTLEQGSEMPARCFSEVRQAGKYGGGRNWLLQ